MKHEEQMVSIEVDFANARFASRVAAIAKRQIESRCAAKIVTGSNDGLVVRLDTRPGIGAEGFRIADGPGGSLLITGNDERGLLAGLGKFLRDASYARGRFSPGAWRGVSAPEKPVRGAYFATHYHNFYHDAPLTEVERYLEDLALWGINTLTVWFDMHHYRRISDGDAQLMIARLKSLLNAAKGLGLSTGLVFIANEAYADSPAELRADYTAGHDGYFRAPGGHYNLELCPNKPGARDLMLQWAAERLEAFADVAPDYLWLWPYDTGGCTCSQCVPWGVNGFLAIAEPTARLYRRHVPHGKVILSTWYFDRFIHGEWEGLARAFHRQKPDWVDYLMADDYGEKFPAFPLQHGAPGGFPLLSFPEISMCNCSNWGGYGANPLPRHFQAIWDVCGQHLAGGFPYSEGIYEDINKIIIAQFQWRSDRTAVDIVKEYAGFEYSPEVVADVLAAVDILEGNNQHSLKSENGIDYATMERSANADRAWSLLKDVNDRLSPNARQAWRWRILYLRGLIDAELAANEFRITEPCEQAFNELTALYHTEHAAWILAPPTREARRARRAW